MVSIKWNSIDILHFYENHNIFRQSPTTKLMQKNAHPSVPVPGIPLSKEHIENPRFRNHSFTKWLRVMVSAGTMSTCNAMIVAGGFASAGSWVTQKIDLPQNWQKLVKKYQNIVPNYINV